MRTLFVNKDSEGGVKMACSSLALALVFWIIVQSSMPALLEAVTTFKVPVDTIQSYLNNYADLKSVDRVRRETRQLPHLENKELSSTLTLAENQLRMMARLDTNIMNADVKVKLGSVLHGAYIESLPTTEALIRGRDAVVVLKASQHIGLKYCGRLGIDDKNCATQVSKLSLSGTQLGTNCAQHYRHNVFCSELTRYRSPDGSCNHPQHPAWGQALTPYRRLLPAYYEDGFQRPRGSTMGRELPSGRLVSTTVSRNVDRPDSSTTLAVLQWAQFIAQDLTHTAVSKMWNTGGSIACCDSVGDKLLPRYLHAACYPIQVPAGDPIYSSRYRSCMSYVRSLPALPLDCTFGPLEQLNQATPLLDGSMLYGSSVQKSNSLRTLEYGRLRTFLNRGRDFLHTFQSLNVNCHVGTIGSCFQTGDVRVNVQPHLAVMHTLWVREHNRIADGLGALNAHWNDEKLYQEARRIVIAEIQHITYNEWLPAVLGTRFMRDHPALAKITGHSNLYREDVNPAVTNSFATAALRAFNSMVEDFVRLYNEERSPQLEPQSITSFHRKEFLHSDDTLDALVRGLATQSAQEMDLHHSYGMQHSMFSLTNTTEGQDSLSLDIQRGRDHGLPSYNSFRRVCGLRHASYFSDFADTMLPETIATLQGVYKTVEDVDLLVGGLAEYAAEGLVGPVFKCILAEQFTRTRSGDRFFYDNADVPSAFTERQLNEIKNVTLARIFCDNTNNVLTMQPYVFNKPISPSNELASCSESTRVRRLSLDPWYEEPPPQYFTGVITH